jgi:F420-dependent oxidoreductase-like protein
MRLRIFCEPQNGASYQQLLAAARATEEAGFDGFFRSDHYLAMAGGGLPGPSDAWVSLAGLARDTERVRLGTLVSPCTFRLPGPLAIAVAGVDAMSGGRVELGMGAGWFEQEHRAYGIGFPGLAERFERLEEQLEIVTGLWSTPPGQTFSFSGRHYRLESSPALPKPEQRPHPPVIVGGLGARRTPVLAARYASEYNAPFLAASECARQFDRVRQACEDQDRDPASLELSAATTLCCGADRASFERRAAAIGQAPEQLRRSHAAGSPAEVAEAIGRYAQAGASKLYLQVLDLGDLDHIYLVGSEVLAAIS